MKPKPLKGKEGYVDSWQIRDRKDVTKVFKSEDVRSACEFFLKELEEIEGDSRSDEDIMRTIKAKFRSAFKDILGGES